MGKLLIRQLREDWTASRGGRAAWKEFHDSFLSYGGPPIPLVRQQMMGEPKPHAEFPESSKPGAVVQQTIHAWDCDNGAYLVTHYQDGTLWLFRPGETVELAHQRAASGSKYGKDGLVFWVKGDEAMLDVAGEKANCTVNRLETPFEDAKLRGADFRAVGNEPGWHLELFSDGPSLLVTDYGQERYEFMAGEPSDLADGVGSVFSVDVDGTPMRIELRPGPCADTMVDRVYETAVRIESGERVLAGCGKALH
jgi:uncharacterized membrane protein